MNLPSSQRFLQAFGVLLLCASGSAVQGSSARDLLFRNMQRASYLNVISVQRKQADNDPAKSQTLQVVQARDGRIRTTVIHPLSQQGLTYIDDGKSWIEYRPDEKLRITMNRPTRLEAHSRIALAERNYNLSRAPGPKIAGRDSIRVTARPKAREMLTRHLYLDTSTSVLLRLETQQGREKALTLIDTVSISFPRSVSGSVFSLDNISRVAELNSPYPVRAGSPANAGNTVGFEYVTPSRLPFGFTVHQSDIVVTHGRGGQRAAFVALRLTDGICNATVLQWRVRPHNLPYKVDKAAGVEEVNGVAFRVVGELPEPARRAMLNAFLTEARKAKMLLQEPPSEAALLHSDSGDDPSLWNNLSQQTPQWQVIPGISNLFSDR